MNPDILKTIYTDVRAGLSFEQVCAKYLPDVSQFVGRTLVCARQGERAFVELLSASEFQAALKEDFRFAAPQWTPTTCANCVVVATCPYKIHDLIIKDNLQLQDYIKHAIKNPPEECAICKDDLFISEREFLPCAHYYHKPCIDAWMKNKNTCPNCRAVIDETKEKRNNNNIFRINAPERNPDYFFPPPSHSSSSRSPEPPSRASNSIFCRDELVYNPFTIPSVHINISPYGVPSPPFPPKDPPFVNRAADTKRTIKHTIPLECQQVPSRTFNFSTLSTSPLQVVGYVPSSPFSSAPSSSNPFAPPSPFCNYTVQ